MDTAAIAYRIVDFLKHHPPFSSMDEADLLALTADGRVRFYEAHQYLLWQGEPHKVHVFVIQQGTVSLWDDWGSAADTARRSRCRRPAGNRSVQWRSVVPALGPIGRRRPDLRLLGRTLSGAAGEVSSRARIRIARTASPRRTCRPGTRREPHQVFLHEVVGRTQARGAVRRTIGSPTSRRRLVDTGASAIAVLDPLPGLAMC